MNRFKTIPIFFFAIQALLSANTFALNAPYLTSATPTNGHSIALNWRNNDFAATKVLVLRKTVATEWVLKDSVAGTVTAYTDSSLQPLTEYSFALLASAPGVLSDTSNVLSVTTPEASEVFVAPKIEVKWVEGQKLIGIRFFDSSNTEKGFRLFRKALAESWAAIDSMVTQAPDTVGWKSFADSAITDNKWYSYKVQVYNDSQTVFSPETTVYNYVQPKKTKSYVMTNKGSIPAMPISWVERIGDSLYFPEVAAPGDTEISVVDVSDPMTPQFRGYVDPENIPVGLKGSVVEARATIAITGSSFEHRNGYYIIAKGHTIYRYDSTSFSVRDSVLFDWFKYELTIFGWLNDSCSMIKWNSGIGNIAGASPVSFGSGGIDTFPESISWWGFNGDVSWDGGVWGCYNNTAFFSNVTSGRMGTSYTYVVQNFSNGYGRPQTFLKNVSPAIFKNAQSRVIDSSVVFTATTDTNYVALYAFNTTDGRSGPEQSLLGKLVDSSYLGGNVNEIVIDSAKKYLYVIGDSGISIYTYIIGPPAGVRNPVISRNSPAKRLHMTQNSRGVCFSIIGAKMQSLQVLNAKGQIVRSAAIPAGETFVWNRRNNAGMTVPVGFYIYKIGTVKGGAIAGSMVLVR